MNSHSCSDSGERVVIVSFASWEERFLRRLEDDLKEREADKIVVFYLHEYQEWTADNRQAVAQLAKKQNINIEEHELSVNSPESNWNRMRDVLGGFQAKQRVLLDISTMPRENIWNALWMLDYGGAVVEYVYSRPIRYNSDWLSKDPLKPRLAYKMSGIMDPAKKLCLVIIAGYDVERVLQLVNFYEPSRTLIGLQMGEVDGANQKKMERTRTRFTGEPGIEYFDVDGYADDHGEGALEAIASNLLPSYNIVMSSLGPKLSAMAMYNLQKRFPEIGLTYAPARQFNKEYSEGTGRSFWGKVL